MLYSELLYKLLAFKYSNIKPKYLFQYNCKLPVDFLQCWWYTITTAQTFMIIDQLLHNVMGQLRIKQPFSLLKQKCYFWYLLKVRIYPKQDANWKEYIISNALKSNCHRLCFFNTFSFSVLPSSSFSFYPNSLKVPYLFPPNEYSPLAYTLEIPVRE